MPNTGNTQQQINYGAAANDGLGDPLRTAFIKTDENFDNIWLAGPVGSNVTITNNTISVNDTNGNLVLQPNGVGIIQTRGSLQSFANNIHNLGTANLRYLSGYFGPGGLDVTGTLTAGNIAATSNLSVTGTLSATNLTIDGDAQISGNLRVQGDIIQVGNIVTDTLTIQLANTAANGSQANGAGITVGAADDIATLLYNNGSNVWTTNIGVTITGNITGDYILGNGAFLTGLPVPYSNANVANYLPIYSGTLNGSILNITDGGANVWNIQTDIMSVPSGGQWRSDPDTLDDFVTSAANGYINLQSLYADGNIASELHLEHGVAQIRVADAPFKEWTFRSSGNLDAAGNIITPDDVFANAFVGDGSQLTGIVAGSNTQVQFNDNGILGADPDFYFVKSTNTLVVNGELNEHSIELGSQGFTDLNSNVIAQVTGNANSYTQINFQNINSGPAATTDYVATAAFGTDSTFFVNLGIASNAYDNLNPNNSLGTSLYPQDGYLYSQGGNTLGGSGGNLVVGSNEPGGVVRVIADGSNEANIVATFSNTGVDVKGDIIPVANSVYSLGNSTNQWANLWVANNTIYIGGVPVGIGAGNVLTVGGEPVLTNDSNTTITTTGNITADYFIGNGSQLTGVISSYGNSNVAAYLPTYTGNIGNVTTSNVANTMTVWGDVQGKGFVTTQQRFIASSTGSGYGAYDQGILQLWRNYASGSFTQLEMPGGTSPNPTYLQNVSVVGNTRSVLSLSSSSLYYASGACTTPVGSLTSSFEVTAGGNLSTGNITTTGNISGDYILGNAAFMTGIPASYGNSNVATFLANFGSNAISTTGNITAGNISGNITITGNVTGTSANVTLIAGSYSTTFDNTGSATLPGSLTAGNLNSLTNQHSLVSGLQQAPSANNFIANSSVTLSGAGGNYLGVGQYPIGATLNGTSVQYGQWLQSGYSNDSSPVYYPIVLNPKGGDVVLPGGGIINKATGFVNAGTFVTLDNIKATVTTSGSRGLSLATVSGTVSGYVSGSYTLISGSPGGSAATVSLTTSASTSILGQNFIGEGDTAIYVLRDNTNSRVYRITMMIGGSYNNNFISIERL